MIKRYKLTGFIILWGIFSLISVHSNAQDKVVLSGTIKDLQSGESIM